MKRRSERALKKVISFIIAPNSFSPPPPTYFTRNKFLVPAETVGQVRENMVCTETGTISRLRLPFKYMHFQCIVLINLFYCL